MEIVKIFNTGDLDGVDYENACGRGAVNRNVSENESSLDGDEFENASGRRGRRGRRGRKRGMRSGLGRESGRRGGRKRKGLNRAIGQSGARKSKINRNEAGKHQGRQSQPRMSNPNYSKSRPIPYETKPPSPLEETLQGRPPRGGMVQIGNNSPIITNDPLQGKPNIMMPQPAPASNNNLKIALIVGGVVILGIAAFFALRFFKARVAKLKKDVIENLAYINVDVREDIDFCPLY